VLEGEALETVKADLKWLSGTCGRARNLDVFAAEILGPADIEAEEPTGLKALHTALDLARHAAWAHAGEACASERFRALMIDLAAWVETGDWAEAPGAGEPVRRFARHALKRHLKKLEKCGRAARGGDDEARHHLRIEGKKLRYACEAFASLFAQRAVERYQRHLKALQETLGALNDLVTAEPLVTALALPSEAAFAAGELVGRKAAGKARLIAQATTELDRLEAAAPFWA
jgi:CHAD domain-containing protein